MENEPLVKSNGFNVVRPKLEACAEIINEELEHLNRLFKEQLVPRCTTIGNALKNARSWFTATSEFYKWCDENVGIKERQVRTYLRFARHIELIQERADAHSVELTSMEQGLELLAEPKEEIDHDTDEARMESLKGSIGRAKGAMSKAHAAICEVVGVDGIDQRTRAAFEAMEYVLNSWAEPTNTDGVIAPAQPNQKLLAVNRQEEWSEPIDVTPTEETPTEDPTPVGDSTAEDSQLFNDRVLLVQQDLPLDEKPGKWTLAQLEQGLALCDDNQSRLAKCIGVTKNAVSLQLKRKRAAVEVQSPTEDPNPVPVAA